MKTSSKGLVIAVVVIVMIGGWWFLLHKKSKLANTIAPVTVTVTPSRSPDAGCTWQAFQNTTLGISMLVESCTPSIGTFLTMGNTIEEQDTYGQSEKVVEMFAKPVGQSVENALQAQFVNPLPGSFSKTCIVQNISSVNDVERYSIVPNPAREAELDKEADGEIPDYGECGPYVSDQESTRYFEYQPNNSMTKFIFVDTGQDTPYFDPDSIRLN